MDKMLSMWKVREFADKLYVNLFCCQIWKICKTLAFNSFHLFKVHIVVSQNAKLHFGPLVKVIALREALKLANLYVEL